SPWTRKVRGVAACGRWEDLRDQLRWPGIDLRREGWKGDPLHSFECDARVPHPLERRRRSRSALHPAQPEASLHREEGLIARESASIPPSSGRRGATLRGLELGRDEQGSGREARGTSQG